MSFVIQYSWIRHNSKTISNRNECFTFASLQLQSYCFATLEKVLIKCIESINWLIFSLIVRCKYIQQLLTSPVCEMAFGVKACQFNDRRAINCQLEIKRLCTCDKNVKWNKNRIHVDAVCLCVCAARDKAQNTDPHIHKCPHIECATLTYDNTRNTHIIWFVDFSSQPTKIQYSVQ